MIPVELGGRCGYSDHYNAGNDCDRQAAGHGQDVPGGHGVVQDGVDGRVDIEHEAAEVKDVEVDLEVDMIKYFIRRDHHPHSQDFERKEAGEEEDDDGPEHDDDLSPPPRHRRRL